MGGYPQLTALTADEFSARSRLHWLTTTKAGIAIGFTALLGLLVGAVVTSQTLYAATAASQREYATLRAMGIPKWRLKLSVLVQSFWVGLFGIILAAPITFALAEAAYAMGTNVRLHPIILGVGRAGDDEHGARVRAGRAAVVRAGGPGAQHSLTVRSKATAFRRQPCQSLGSYSRFSCLGAADSSSVGEWAR